MSKRSLCLIHEHCLPQREPRRARRLSPPRGLCVAILASAVLSACGDSSEADDASDAATSSDDHPASSAAARDGGATAGGSDETVSTDTDGASGGETSGAAETGLSDGGRDQTSGGPNTAPDAEATTEPPSPLTLAPSMDSS